MGDNARKLTGEACACDREGRRIGTELGVMEVQTFCCEGTYRTPKVEGSSDVK